MKNWAQQLGMLGKSVGGIYMENQQKVLCSYCGCGSVHIIIADRRVFAKCTECASTSEIVSVVEPPRIEFRFGESSRGMLSVKNEQNTLDQSEKKKRRVIRSRSKTDNTLTPRATSYSKM